ncbi:structure-specific endonuclease subunit SLX4 isoform X2 [Nannospalax galili]|uniref:structure-specific endonuclease subunit SLX4 isoform X2 n=1 Tax=Nannospalax galili TaxID=1026970 RepID=UPI00111BD589|nr:structure-specific endonuclease subunit SLX4 isoform X2 [Nannospalax galili]
MMDESDDDFKDLCASFFQRVKKNATKEVSGERKTQKASNSTQKRNKLKKPDQVATRSNLILQDPSEKKPRSGSQAPRTKKQAATKSRKGELAVSENGEGGVLVPAADQPVLCEKAPSIQTESVPNGNSQPSPSCLTMTPVPSPSKPRASELVLQRMQQFKRADPERLRHVSEESSLKTTLEENVPKTPQEKMVLGNGYKPKLPATDSDAAVALALQQEFGQEGASAPDDSLEEKGLFFCQMCQKNLSAMNVTRREQHVNRCLDEAEKALRPAMPQIPDCPICGKPFLTTKSRISHLKQCAVKMEVGPQLLLQAVRLQTAQPKEGSSPQAPSNHIGGLKRKGATNKKEPQKRRKVNRPEAPSEDMLVAMALSRSEMEQCPAVPTLSLESAFSEKIKLGAEKKSRKKKPLVCPPQLLVQDSETTGRQIEDRVAQLLSEEMELSSTPPLPASRIFKEELEEATWRLQLPKGKQNFLWEGSALTGAWAEESFYTMGLVPPIMPRKPTKEPELPLALPKQLEPGIQRPPAHHSNPPMGHSPRNQLLSSSQREHQALQDLVDLAEEGLSASSWPSSLGVPTGLDLVPNSPPLTGFILPSKEKPLKKGGHASLSLGLLAADFGAMVNNPHLSDVQFQTDSGTVFYAHKFVLYARCPLLIQYVNSDGFSAVEDGDLTQRILLNDVSPEAAHAFLNYLYMADTDLPPSLAPDLRSLALRFGVHDLVHLCEQVPVMTDLEGELQEEKEDKNCESRAENFQELLRSMWVDEEEEAETLLKSEVCEEDREKVNEAEMEEIYEFAATQRKLLQGERAANSDNNTGRVRDVNPVAWPTLADVQGNGQLEKAEKMESSKLGKKETLTSWENTRYSFLLLHGQCSDRAGEVETKEQQAPREAGSHPSSCSPSGSPRVRSKEGSLLYPVKTHDYKQLFVSTQREFSELSQITVDHKQLSDTVKERQVEKSHSSSPEEILPSCPHFLLSQSPTDASPSQSWHHLYSTSDLSPSVSQSHSGISKVASPSSPSPVTPAKQRRNRSVLTLLKEPGHQKGKRGSSMLECKNRGILTSPAKSLPIDLTQSVSDHLSSKTQDPPCHVKKEDEIILLLDSDEELELEHNKTKLISNDSSEERKVLEVSPKSSELFSVIDVDEEQEHFQSSLKREAELQQEEVEGQQENQAVLGSRGIPWLFCNQNSPDEDSTTDTSWLVPATPLASRSRDCSAQTQITSLRTRTLGDETAHLTPRASLEHWRMQEAAQKFSVIMPQALPVVPGTSDSGRQAYRSPSHPYSRCHKLSSPQPSCPLPDLTRRSQKLLPPGPCLSNQAAADEVVEVGDSDDEQEMASHQENGSSLLDGDLPVPMGNCCWHVEPLSPIPIDHLNLERTGPLSTSSPSSQAQEALYDSNCHSPGLLGTTPIQGSCAAQRDSQEQSPQASSPGNSKLSFLNPALWDDWNEDDQNSPEAAPAAQTPSARAQKPEGPETPSANRKKNLPPKVPITPMPRYSIMETPVLKKELDRFGVRALPKRQMILKLKEIFQYTHQTLESDSEDEIQSSQVSPGVPCSQAPAIKSNKRSRSGGYTQLKTTAGLGTQRSKGSTKTKGPQHRKKQLSESIPHPSRSPAGEPPPDPNGNAQLPAFQESIAASVDGSDSSFGSQSSSCEFGAALESAGEDKEGEEGVGASQAAIQAANTEETVRRYICSKPALYRKVLMYQPLELAELQAELKQDGIHVAMGKLLDILDAQCITFTTAAARKEKLKQKRRQHFGRKKKGRE